MQKHSAHNQSLSRIIFQYLAETSIDLLQLGVTIAIDPYQFLPGGKYSLTPRQRANRIAAMKETLYFRRQESSHSYMLTSIGRIAAIKLKIANKREHIQKNWDGWWRIVTYDVSELTRKQRDLLRGQLKTLGFAELQKSVWVIPVALEKELYALLELWNIEIRKGDVRVILAKTITKDTDLKHAFHLTP